MSRGDVVGNGDGDGRENGNGGEGDGSGRRQAEKGNRAEEVFELVSESIGGDEGVAQGGDEGVAQGGDGKEKDAGGGKVRKKKDRKVTGGGIESYSRKDKSLALLCERFVENFGMKTGEEVCIDIAGNVLNVERRRIYDIVNVLEAIGVVVRKAKNRYMWLGTGQMELTFAMLKRRAMGIGGEGEVSGISSVVGPMVSGVTESMGDGVALQSSSTGGSQETVIEEADIVGGSQEKGQGIIMPTRPMSRKEKSLATLSQRFVQCFLLAPDTILSLDEAARRMLAVAETARDPLVRSPADQEISRMKTKIRRLYDIANILTSFKLLEKVQTGDRRPAYRWLGIDGRRRGALGKRAAENSDHSSSTRTAIKRRRTPPIAPRTRASIAKRSRKAGEGTPIAPSPTPMSRQPHDQQLQHSSRPQAQQYLQPDQITQMMWMQQMLHMQQQMMQKSTDGISGTSTLTNPFRSQNPSQAVLFSQWKAWMEQNQKQVKAQHQEEDQNESPVSIDRTPTLKKPAAVPCVSTVTGVKSGVESSVANKIAADKETNYETSVHPNTPSKTQENAPAESKDASATPTRTQAPRPQPGMPNTNCFGTSHAHPYAWMSPEYVKTYMEQAEKAGSQYAEQAQKWLESLKQWQSTWGAWVTGVNSKLNESFVTNSAMPTLSIGAQPQQQHAP